MFLDINIKIIDKNASIPKYAYDGDAGLDLTAINKTYSGHSIIYGTGIAVQIPSGFFGLIIPRSSIYKTDLFLTNHCGIIDSNYTGEIKFIFKRDFFGASSNNPIEYNIGERVGQLIILPYPKINFNIVNNLEKTQRGNNGFGSSGN